MDDADRDAAAALTAAKTGDWDALAQHISGGGEITEPMREFLAGVLQKTVKRSANRPPKASTRDRLLWWGMFVTHLRNRSDFKVTAAIAEGVIMEVMKVDRSTVQRAVRAFRKEAATMPIYTETAKIFAEQGLPLDVLDIAGIDMGVNLDLLENRNMDGRQRWENLCLAIVDKYAIPGPAKDEYRANLLEIIRAIPWEGPWLE